MARKKQKPKNIILSALELIGKPVFLLFTFCVKIVAQLCISIIKLPHIPPIIHLKFPKLKCVLIFGIFGYFIFTSVTWFTSLPSPTLLRSHRSSLSTQILARDGQLLYKIYSDENRTLVKLSDLPNHLLNATIAIEDKDFYRHHGISFVGIARAIIKNSTNNSKEGGSTITQQLIKNTLLSPEKTWERKFKEVILSLETEISYSKAEILEMYLNEVSYGGTAYGIEAASQQYLGKAARDLTLGESALLAGLPQAPTTYSPFGGNPYLAKERQSQVLTRMQEDGYITSQQKESAIRETIILNPRGIDIRAPHFVMWLKDKLVQEYGESLVSRGGLIVKTTLDLDKQQLLESEINAELIKLKTLHVKNGAGLITEPKTGEILAMVGSRNYFDFTNDGQVNVTNQARQPGSSIKPITYSLAFMNGLSPSSYIEDFPVCFRSKGSPDYCPNNYDGRFHGRVTLRTALGSSYNIPAVKLLNSLGIEKMISLARNMGITTWDDSSRFGLSLTLGGGEITMLDMARVYGTFANMGINVPLTGIISVTDSQGDQLQKVSSTGTQIIPEGVAFQINSVLSDPIARAPAFGARSILNITGQIVAVKTGTTNNMRDNWTFGYTPNILVAIWVGNNDNTPMSSVASGITGASPIWSNVIKKILGQNEPLAFPIPENLIKITNCDKKSYSYFIPGTEIKPNCNPLPSTGTLLPKAASTNSQ